MNVIVYAIASRSGGALSVLSDFYKEVTENADKYKDITWYFTLSTQNFDETENVKIIKNEWAIKTWFHRAYFNLVTVNKIIKKHNIKAIVSLQNMRVMGTKVPNIVCLHNVLPLYKCDARILDNIKQRMKQMLVNQGIVNSLKKAYRVMVASQWIKDELIEQFGIKEKQVVVSPLIIPEAGEKLVELGDMGRKDGKKVSFFYPASAFPYKNHMVVLKACKILKEKYNKQFDVEFTIEANQGKTAAQLYEYATQYELPVSFVGNLPREVVLQAYLNKVLLFPSKIENDAMPLIECIQYNGYVLAADLPYAKDVLDAYPNKKYFGADDAESLALYMKELIENGIVKDETVTKVTKQKDMSRPEKVAMVLRELEKEYM